MKHIATIQSLVYPKIIPSGIEPGFYELKVFVDLTNSLGDPAGYVRAQVAAHLAQCVQSTGIPLYEKCWTISFSKFAQDNFHYPEVTTI